MTKKKTVSPKDTEWARAKKLCKLNADDIRKAKELGFKPKSLIKNIPNQNELWKAPVKEWIRDLYDERYGKNECKKNASKNNATKKTNETPVEIEKPIPNPLPEPLPLDDDWLDDEMMNAIYDEEYEDFDAIPADQCIDIDNQRMLKRWKDFQLAAKYVSSALSQFSEVEKIVLFGSAAVPLIKEVPRFRQYRQQKIELWHECKDVDLAVWVNDLTILNSLRKSNSQALNQLLRDTNIGVAHHQVDILIMEPNTDRYLGRLCSFASCPKEGKPKCLVPGCGETEFLEQKENFKFYSDALHPDKIQVLFDRENIIPDENKDNDIPF